MADISKVTASDGTTYDLKDTTARNAINNLAAVATSGDYDDLTNKPTIPAAQVNSDWNATSGVEKILNKPTLAAVATSGAASNLYYNNAGTTLVATNAQEAITELDTIFDYNWRRLSPVALSGDYDDLTNKPTIPDISTKLDKTSGTGSGNFNISGDAATNNSFYVNQTTSGNAYIGVRDGTVSNSNKSSIYMRSASSGERNFTATDASGNTISLFTISPTNTVGSTVFGRPYVDSSNSSDNAYIRTSNTYKNQYLQIVSTSAGNRILQSNSSTWVQEDNSGTLTGAIVAAYGSTSNTNLTAKKSSWTSFNTNGLSFSKGLWIVWATVMFPYGNTSGYRGINMHSAANTYSNLEDMELTLPMTINNTQTIFGRLWFVNNTSSSAITRYINIANSSSSDITGCKVTVQWIKLHG